jgi:hypothetical protein
MTQQQMKISLMGLQWTLGVVVLIEAVLFVMPGTRQEFARTHLPDIVRLVLGWGEIVGAALLLMPRTVVRGGWILAGVFVLAIVIHLLHGMFNVGSLIIYTAAAWAVAAGNGAQSA